jgi:hypothetical protein
VADIGTMLETGRREMETPRPDVGPMGRRMPRIFVRLTPREQLGPLLGRKLTPAVRRWGHSRSVSASQGGGKTRVRNSVTVPSESRWEFRGLEFRVYAGLRGFRRSRLHTPQAAEEKRKAGLF